MAGDGLLTNPDLPVGHDELPYGEVIAQNKELVDQLVDADINRRPTLELAQRQAELQTTNPAAFQLLSQAALHDTL